MSDQEAKEPVVTQAPVAPSFFSKKRDQFRAFVMRNGLLPLRWSGEIEVAEKPGSLVRTSAKTASYYNAVDPAYDLAVKSYETGRQRVDMIDGRIQTTLGLCITITAAVPAIASNRGIALSGGFFYAAIIVGAFVLIVGTIGRIFGKIRVLNPIVINREWLTLSKYDFKLTLVATAAKAHRINERCFDFRRRIWILTSVLVFVQALLLALWSTHSAGRHPGQ